MTKKKVSIPLDGNDGTWYFVKYTDQSGQQQELPINVTDVKFIEVYIRHRYGTLISYTELSDEEVSNL